MPGPRSPGCRHGRTASPARGGAPGEAATGPSPTPRGGPPRREAAAGEDPCEPSASFGRWTRGRETTQRLQVSAIEIERRVLRRLEKLRNGGKARVGEQIPESRFADRAAADVLVPVDARAAGPLGVVDVHGRDARQTHGAVERGDRVLPPAAGDEVVAGRVDVARVQADADPPPRGGRHDGAHDVAQVLERVADGVALAGGGFEKDAHALARRSRADLAERCGDSGDARGFPLSAVRAGMKHELADTETGAAADLVGERGDRLAAEL